MQRVWTSGSQFSVTFPLENTWQHLMVIFGLPLVVQLLKESTCNAGGPCSTPGSGRFPGEGNGNPLQYSCLENPMDREAWHATLHGIEKGRTRLSDLTTEADFGHHN